MTNESEQSTQSDVTAAELLGAVKGFLMDSVLPAVSGRDQFNTRVAANVLGIIEREHALALPCRHWIAKPRNDGSQIKNRLQTSRNS